MLKINQIRKILNKMIFLRRIYDFLVFYFTKSSMSCRNNHSFIYLFLLFIFVLDATYSIEYVSGDGQSGTTGKALSNQFVVIVRGFKNNVPAQGVNVTWEFNQGDGKFVSQTTMTDMNGKVYATVELGYTIGTNIVTASLSTAIGSPVIFYATGVKGPCLFFVFFLFVFVEFFLFFYF